MTSQGCICVQCVTNGLCRKLVWLTTEQRSTLQRSNSSVLCVRDVCSSEQTLVSFSHVWHATAGHAVHALPWGMSATKPHGIVIICGHQRRTSSDRLRLQHIWWVNCMAPCHNVRYFVKTFRPWLSLTSCLFLPVDILLPVFLWISPRLITLVVCHSQHFLLHFHGDFFPHGLVEAVWPYLACTGTTHEMNTAINGRRLFPISVDRFRPMVQRVPNTLQYTDKTRTDDRQQNSSMNAVSPLCSVFINNL